MTYQVSTGTMGHGKSLILTESIDFARGVAMAYAQAFKKSAYITRWGNPKLVGWIDESGKTIK